MDWSCLCIGGLVLFIMFMQQVMDFWLHEELEGEKDE